VSVSPAGEERPALLLEGVERRFGALCALRNVNLAVAPRERRAILGTNGAGKTTLFNAIAGDFPPTKGRVRLFGADVTSLPSHARIRRGLSRTYQNSLLFAGLSVADNLYLAARGVRPNRFSLRKPGLGDAYRARADEIARMIRLDTVMDRLVSDLSHGQQRQLELGMALAGEPRLMLLDEPAAGLSPLERHELIHLLRSLSGGLTLVLIEHDMDVALQIAERVSVMQHGEIIVEGTPAEIADSEMVHEIYLGRHGR
jgi:branched-chain amino acid transport system ATP-binding protein